MAHVRVRTAERDLHSGCLRRRGAERRARAHADARRTSCAGPDGRLRDELRAGRADAERRGGRVLGRAAGRGGRAGRGRRARDRAGRRRASSTRAPGRTRASTSTASRAATPLQRRTIIPCTASARLSDARGARPGRRARSPRRWSASCARRRRPGAEVELDVEPGEPAGFDAADPVLALARDAIGRAVGSAPAVRAHRRLDPDPRRRSPSAASRRCCRASRSTPTASTGRTRATASRASRSASAPRASSTPRSRRSLAQDRSGVGRERRLDALARDQLDAVGSRARPSARDPRRARTARAASRRGRGARPRPGRPTPQRTRPKSRVPRRSATERRPLWPPSPPPSFARTWPKRASTSSCTQITWSGLEPVGAHRLAHGAAREVHEPERAQQRDRRPVLEPHLAERAAVLLALGRRVPARGQLGRDQVPDVVTRVSA